MICLSKLSQDLINTPLNMISQIGETIACKSSGKPLPAIKVEEPTVKMAFSINTSPFVGREVLLYFSYLQVLPKLCGILV